MKNFLNEINKKIEKNYKDFLNDLKNEDNFEK